VLATEIIEKLPRMASEKGWVFTAPRPVFDKILNHSSGKIAGVAKIYNKFEYPPNGRLRSRQGPNHVESLIRPTPFNVVELPRRADV
jgi:hypothetical protein